MIVFSLQFAFSNAFVPYPRTQSKIGVRQSNIFGSRDEIGSFDPFSFSEGEMFRKSESSFSVKKHERNIMGSLGYPLIAISAMPSISNAAEKKLINVGDFNPDNFKPVCSTSDSLYRFLQVTTKSVVGEDNFVEYGPLIAGGLLRIRLELCVVESFFNEAVGPFIEKNGLNWILPLHETVETFLAGTIFAAASTFILVGSTKIVAVIFTYGDVFIGVPCRLFGGFFFDRAQGKPVTLEVGIGPWKKQVFGPPIDKEKIALEAIEGKKLIDMDAVTPASIPVLVSSGAVKLIGETSKVARDVTDSIDIFVGKYLTLIATGYIGLKFIHFKVFPDFP